MKISITITQKEKEDTNNKIWIDPCAYIECGSVESCEQCPLRDVAANLREAQHKFMNIVNSMPIQN